MIDTSTVSIIIAIVGCAIEISGWVGKKQGISSKDAEWRGTLNAKLGNIMASVTGLRGDVERIDRRLLEHGERIAKVEASASSLHKRIDGIEKGI